MKKNPISELRQDIVSGDWVIIATNRAKRPHLFAKKRTAKHIQSIAQCPFENPQKSGKNNAPLIVYKNNSLKTKLHKQWSIYVINNKYPVFSHNIVPKTNKYGPYYRADGYGFHEIFIYKNHTKTFAQFNMQEMYQTFSAFIKRYTELQKKKYVQYISIFHNHGEEAGASFSHPHSQLIAMPAIPPDISKSIKGSARFYHTHKKCIHCVMIKFERKEKKRIIFENKHFIAFCPYASRVAFEIRIFPKRHESNFEKTSDSELMFLGETFSAAIRKLHFSLKNPAYNFFIHTSPTIRSNNFNHYHWHIEILPKTSIWAGFEISTGMEISAVAPEQAAKQLRRIKTLNPNT